MGASDVQIRIIGQDVSASSALLSVNSAAKRTQDQIASLGRATSNLNSVFTSAAGFAAGIAGFNGLTAAIQGTVGAAFGFAKSMEVHETGLAGILLSMTEIDGRTLTWGESIMISKDIMAQLNSEALRTAATTEELTTAFRGILGPALNAKMTINEIMQLTVTGVNAVKSIMPTNSDMQRQLVQELRDLVAGGIQASSSTLATALGLKDKDIKAAKESAEGLFKFLMDRLKGFEISAPAYARTWQGISEQIKEGVTLAGSKGFEPLFNAIKEEMNDVAGDIIRFNQEAGKMEVNPSVVQSFRTVANLTLAIGRNMDTILITAGSWMVLTRVSALYADVAAVTAGATTAQTFLGKAVLDTQLKYAQQSATALAAANAQKAAAVELAQAQVQSALAGTTMQTAAVAAAVGQNNLSAAIVNTVTAMEAENMAAMRTAEIINTANAAAKAGQYEIAQAVLATNLTIEQQALLAGIMAERMTVAIGLAKSGQLGLAQTVLATNIVLAEQGTAAMVAGEKAVTAASVSRTAASSMLQGLFNLAGGWAGVAIATGLATDALLTYFNNKNRVESYNSKTKVYMDENGRLTKEVWDPEAGITELGTSTGGYIRQELSPEEYSRHYEHAAEMERIQNGDYGEEFRRQAADLENRLTGKYPGIGDDDKAAAKAARAAERAYEEQQRLQDKVADMLAKMDEKVSGVTATAYETSTKKLQDETDNMRRSLDKSAIDFVKYGIDVTDVYAKIGVYQEAMTANIEKQRSQALAGLSTDTAGIAAGISEDPRAQADAEYQKEMARIQRERENDEAFKKVAKGPDDAEARAAADANYAAQEMAALKARNDKYRDYNLKKYEWDVQYNNDLLVLNKKTASETDAANLEVYNNEIKYLNDQLALATTVGQKRMDLENQLADIVQKKNDILAHDLSTAYGIAVQEIQNRQIDYRDMLIQTYDDIEDTYVSNIDSMLKNTESVTDGIKNIFTSMVDDVLKQLERIWVQNQIMPGILDMMGSFLGMNWSNNTDVNTWSTSHGGSAPTFENGGLGLTGIGTGGSWLDGKRALGGPVSAGRLYQVNDDQNHGIEAFMPNVNGYILNAGQTKQMMSGSSSIPNVQVNVVNNTGQEAKATARSNFDPLKNVLTLEILMDKVERNESGSRDFFFGRS